MPQFKISARSVGLLMDDIEAENEEEALQVLEDRLEQGDMPEADGWIEGQTAELLDPI